MKKNKILIGSRASKLALIYANRARDEIAKVFSGENSTTDGVIFAPFIEIMFGLPKSSNCATAQ